MATLVIHDETATGREIADFTVPDVPSRVTVRELVRLRVRAEVEAHNARPRAVFRGLVRPTDAEITANGYLLRKPRQLDWGKQAAIAEKAFAGNGFFVLVGDRQVESLDETVELSADTRVSFVRLVPLAGG
ncbi:hypothetical protein [Amycolatopsis sp. CA-230715]|uniref:hypothetical protein n=1 Tax=Amycolatopsis sp. CA-230715 TaxID=2745196 RepID=UPI001C02C1D2|nr:hypothetical protein [Amycolatopsis sp. CA-230715]QWF81625.1 hypothetical protein HUW46_05058 [Amycolatopsis sp. CA-230715]